MSAAIPTTTQLQWNSSHKKRSRYCGGQVWSSPARLEPVESRFSDDGVQHLLGQSAPSWSQEEARRACRTNGRGLRAGLIDKEGTFHLESGAEYGGVEKKDGKVVNSSLFMSWQSEVALFDAGEFIDPKDYAKVSVNSWRAMIALLYELAITLDQFMAKMDCDEPTERDHYILQAVTQVANVLALSKIMGCIDRIAPKLAHLLTADDRVWRAMAHSDALTISYPLSEALRSKALYIDTILHAHYKAASLRRVRERGSYELTSLINFLGLPHHMMDNSADATIKTNDAAFDALEQKLRNIALVPIVAEPDSRGFQATATSFSNAASYRGRQPIQPSKNEMQAEQLTLRLGSRHYSTP